MVRLELRDLVFGQSVKSVALDRALLDVPRWVRSDHAALERELAKRAQRERAKSGRRAAACCRVATRSIAASTVRTAARHRRHGIAQGFLAACVACPDSSSRRIVASRNIRR